MAEVAIETLHLVQQLAKIGKYNELRVAKFANKKQVISAIKYKFSGASIFKHRS